MVNNGGGQEAPGTLEAVRTLLNTWRIPNDTRRAEDEFDAYASEARLPQAQRQTILDLREDLRAAVEHTADTSETLNHWITHLKIRPHLTNGAIEYRPDQPPTPLAATLLAACLEAIAANRWHRLKACPDCRWAFYDHSRNGSKRWCLMTAGGPDGRSCGGIAKVRAHRERTRAAQPTSP